MLGMVQRVWRGTLACGVHVSAEGELVPRSVIALVAGTAALNSLVDSNLKSLACGTNEIADQVQARCLRSQLHAARPIEADCQCNPDQVANAPCTDSPSALVADRMSPLPGAFRASPLLCRRAAVARDGSAVIFHMLKRRLHGHAAGAIKP